MKSLNVKTTFKSITLVVAILLVLGTYNNCSSEHGQTQSQSVNELPSAWSCADQLDDMSLFGRTYHNFLQNNCNNCHSGAGPGPGAFASSGIQLAFTSFEALGAARINARAVDNHSPNANSSNQDEIDELSSLYIQGLQTIEECRGSGQGELLENQDDATRLRMISKPINPDVARPVTVSWNIATDSIPLAGFTPAQFANMRIEADVQVFQKPGIINYVVSNPRLYTNNGDIHIKSLLFKINGKPTPAQRAFYLVNQNLRAWNNAHPDFNKADPNPATQVNEYEYQARLISGGSLVMLGEVRTTDVLSISIELLERITLPPPDLGPSISFGQTTMAVNEGYQVVNIPIVLSRAATEAATAEIVFGADTSVKDECCRPTVNDDGTAIQVRHFDRDIQDFDLNPDQKINQRVNFDSATTRGRYLVNFKVGDTQQVLRIKIVDDQRDEANEVLHLRIDSNRLFRAVPLATNQEFRLTINDNDAPYTGNPETYTDLLSDGGMLEQGCLRCHNSVLFRGGYDITHYELLVSRGILIPGNPNQSLMFRRMDANTPGLLPMPLTGLLDPLDRARVSGWIQIGAPNN